MFHDFNLGKKKKRKKEIKHLKSRIICKYDLNYSSNINYNQLEYSSIDSLFVFLLVKF